ncbi:circularly permuted type 2 ATP-grasp protein [Pseudoclavibacter endophyticus]|uniref:circularly permuted type 2 ATP-grasp protein n=1 Tax=Pseudoclavibacter endophyticus TaxID=1778590 RepID=UPI0016645D4E|nr:circularly permuted type 2 ATP-grasp protein [Pseudoclavibacter endophyticus]
MTSIGEPATGADEATAPFQERVAGRDGIDDALGAEVAHGRLTGAKVDDERLVNELLRLDRRTFRSALADVRRFVQDDGITYGAHAEGEGGRAWRIDPLPVVLDAQEWQRLERGLHQRAHVLGLVFDDLSSRQRLLHDGILPAASVLGHPGYVRPAFGISPERRPLAMGATDLGRDADGNWNVLYDRTQAPSGAGYAMATRRIVSRILPRLHRSTEMSTLLGYFHTMAAAIRDTAPTSDAPPRVVLLSPGPLSETAFDQAFTASLLGVPLVEADDLVVRDAKVWLRGSHGLVPVDVVVRRVDETYSDPLDLRGDSKLGVPGLVESTRLGNTTVLNPIGSGVLENGVIIASFDRITRELLGEDPILPSPPTWWCGDAKGLQHVLANLERLVIKPAARAEGSRLIEGWMLTNSERDALRSRVQAEPWAWIGQEPLPLSTTSIVTEQGLEQRNFVLRTFGVRLGDDHVVMRGGLGRVSATAGASTVSSERGALAKDVWVLGNEPGAGYPLPSARGERAGPQRRANLFETTPRGADNLYWLGRYTERTDGTTRLLAVTNDLAGDHSMHPGTPGAAALEAVLSAIPQLYRTRPMAEGESVADFLRHLVAGPAPHGTVAASVDRVVRAAQGVRDLVSGDTWAVLASLERAVAEIPDDADELQPHFDALLGPILALQGITDNSMYRDTTWAFIDAGTRMERAQFVLTVLRNVFVPGGSPITEFHISEAVLAVGDSTISHRRRVASAIGPSTHLESTLDLLVTDRGNPRSVEFQLEHLATDLETVGDVELSEAAQQLAARVSWLDLSRLADDRDALFDEFGAVLAELRELNDRLTQRHFRRQLPLHAVQPQRWSMSERWLAR